MKPINAGDLRHRIKIQQEVFADDPDTKETISSWQDSCIVYAAVEPLRGREFFQALETHSELTTKIRIRYRPGITSEMRVIYGDRILYIQAVIDPEERHQEMQLMCIERNPSGPGE